MRRFLRISVFSPSLPQPLSQLSDGGAHGSWSLPKEGEGDSNSPKGTDQEPHNPGVLQIDRRAGAARVGERRRWLRRHDSGSEQHRRFGRLL